jgi:phosphoglycerate dehydrogenase-like enzyme
MLLHFVKDVGATTAFQARGEWRHRETETLRGRRALVLGAGGVGREVARLLAAVGMDVGVVARSARTDAELGRVHALGELDALLPEAEFLVLAVPLTPATRGLLGRDQLARLPRGVRIVNVARGAVIDDDALIDALRHGHVGGAALDVFVDEPLAPAHPFWGLERAIVSPHMGGDVHGWREACAARFVANLRRWVSGDPLECVVDKTAGA